MELSCRDFRLLEKSKPSFEECAQTHDSFISRLSHVAAMLTERMKAELLRELQGSSSRANAPDLKRAARRWATGSPASPTNPTPSKLEEGEGGRGIGGAKFNACGKKGKKARTEGATAWPDITQLEKEEYAHFRREVADKFSNESIFFLANRFFKRDKCQKSHNVLDGYEAVKAKFTSGD